MGLKEKKRMREEEEMGNGFLWLPNGYLGIYTMARMRYVFENEPYCLNLIDTPGHVDFSYEVSRSLAACEGALLVVDASQGVEAQTLANVYLALENNLEIIPVLNKIDLPGAEPVRVSQEIEEPEVCLGLLIVSMKLMKGKKATLLGTSNPAMISEVIPAQRKLYPLLFSLSSNLSPLPQPSNTPRLQEDPHLGFCPLLPCIEEKSAFELLTVLLSMTKNLGLLEGFQVGSERLLFHTVVGLDCSDAIHCSAKEGIGITEILNAIVKRIPPPCDTAERPLRALIFDSYYDPYRGVIVYFRVIDGTIKKGDRIYFMASKKDYFADEIGVLSPNQLQADELYAGEVGYLAASIRSVADARVGDTITHYGRKAENSLPGYEEATPMVFCGLFPVDADKFPDLRDALEKLQLNDAALKFEPETSSAMGFGFRCGFLGLLHMEIIQERLEREYNLTLITTAPSVVYRVNCINGDTVECSNPSLLPEPGKRTSIEEPYVKIEMLTPKDYIGPLMELAQDRRGEFKEMKFITENRASITYELPLAEMVGDFFDQLKSRSKGYASMEYSFLGYKESELIKLDIQINGERVEPLATIVHKDKVT
ncbi:Translation factor GUF1-like, chloroplastic [Vitis vinifera]|uniref:Translation factor GUF1 homolog, mitochondrial n=1 Tax=Vitis vinifera TaxID=29760 RepID=A0A438KJT5_VITVI|nr:Translation factor GUF1-like, chloroplastic [Vitis vinifera]